MNIEIITTPNDHMKETGFGTRKACDSFLESSIRIGHATKLNICRTKEDLDAVVNRKPNLVVLAVKYLPIENEPDIWLSEYFSNHNISHTGSSRDVLKFDSDKILAKEQVMSFGIVTAKFFSATPQQHSCANDLPLPFPLFLKPTDAANGSGVDDLSFVNNFIEFEEKVLSITDLYDLPTLAEEYLDGPEFTVAILKTLHDGLIVSAVEIIPAQSKNGCRILGEKAKQENFEELKKIDNEEVKTCVLKLATDSFLALGAEGFGRIDIKSTLDGRYLFMEANLVPGMTSGSSYFPMACEIDSNLSYDKVVGLILEQALG